MMGETLRGREGVTNFSELQGRAIVIVTMLLFIRFAVVWNRVCVWCQDLLTFGDFN